jgi:Ca2+-binding RTX toxin-like protein
MSSRYAPAGTDLVTVNDLAGAGLTRVRVDLATDGQADQVVLNATAGANTVTVSTAGGAVVTGLAASVDVFNADPTLDTLTINGLGGDDTIDAGGLVAGKIKLAIDGGSGNDVITGSRGADTVFGGSGADQVIDTDFVNFDVHDGGAGVDTIDYSHITFSSGVVTINLATGQTAVNGGNTETISNFENATGSQGGETIIGSAAVNVLDGAGGNDTLDGAAGNDTMTGGAGNDTRDNVSDRCSRCGGGNDTVFAASTMPCGPARGRGPAGQCRRNRIGAQRTSSPIRLPAAGNDIRWQGWRRYHGRRAGNDRHCGR